MVTQVGRVDDQGFNQAAWEAIQEIKNEGLAEKTAFIETIDSRDYEDNIRVFADAGYDVVVTVGIAQEAASYKIAGLYPQVYFIGVDQRPTVEQDILPNIVWLVFPEDRLGFLAGAMASAISQTGRVGAVMGSDALPQMKLYGDGFMAGVKYLNPDVKATVSYNSEVDLGASLSDPGWGETAASSLIDEGADIIFGVGGTTGSSALEAAATRGAYVIGAETDQYNTLPTISSNVLTSVLKLVGRGVLDLLKAARDAQEYSSPHRMGVYFGQIGFAPYHELVDFIPDLFKQQMSSLPQALQSGEIQLDEPTPAP